MPPATKETESPAIPADLLAKAFADGMKQALEAQATKERKINPDPPMISAFNPAGEVAHPRPTFHRRPFTNGAPEDKEALTREEIEAFNALSRLLIKPGDKRTARNGKYVAVVSANGDELHISFPCRTIEDHATLPQSVRMLCAEFIDGAAVTNPDQMLDLITDLKARLEAMEAAQR